MMRRRSHLTPYQQVELYAADYIATLWGKQRREFARQYWRHLIRDPNTPVSALSCLGGRRIVRRLRKILASVSWTDWGT